MLAFWKEVQGHLQKGEKTFIALVAENTKGSPGTPGAKFLMSDGGDLWGTIGGGAMEYNLVDRARNILKESGFAPEVQTLWHRRTGEGEKSGMICAGSQTNIYCLCLPERDGATVDRIVELAEKEINAIVTINANGLQVDDTEGNLEEPKIKLDREGEKWRYEEQLLNRKRLAIVGGGHCSVALCQTMTGLGYEVFIFDTREDVFTLKKAEGAREIRIVKDYSEVGGCLRFPELTCVAIMTTDFVSDFRGLLGTVPLPFPFIGVMGSMTKIKEIYDALEKEGLEKERLEKVYAPIGLSLNSDTPEEIAVSVAAQILQERNVGGKLPRN